MKLIKVFMVILLLNTYLFGEDGDKKVKLLGKLNPNAPEYITPLSVEKTFKLQKFHLYNPWEKQENTYEGILLNQLIEKYGSKDTKILKLIALDDYTIDFPKSLYENERILLAAKVDGEFISIREKGPMRIVFVDYNTEEKKYELNLEKWLWMIKKIEFQ